VAQKTYATSWEEAGKDSTNWKLSIFGHSSRISGNAWLAAFQIFDLWRTL